MNLQVEGCVVGGTAEHLQGASTITLADIRADEMASGADLMRVLSAKGPRDLAALHRMRLSGVRLQNPAAPLSVTFEPCPE